MQATRHFAGVSALPRDAVIAWRAHGPGGMQTESMKHALYPLGVLLFGTAALFAESKTSGDWTYTTNEAGEATITGYKGPGGEVAIPAEIDGLPVRHIGDSVFANPGPLPEGVPAEAAGPQLTGVKFPDGLATIGAMAFLHGEQLTDLVIPDSVTAIGKSAFVSCVNVTNLTLGKGLQTVGEAAFTGLGKLTAVSLPATATNIGPGAFGYCTALTDIAVSDDNPAYKSVDGVLFDKEGKTLVQFPAGKSGAYTVPDTVTAIAPAAFEGASAVEKIEFSAELAGRLDSLGLPEELLAKTKGGAAPAEEKADARAADNEDSGASESSPGNVIAKLTVGQITYEDVSLKKEFPQSLFIKHAAGMTFLERGDLSEEQIAALVGSAKE